MEEDNKKKEERVERNIGKEGDGTRDRLENLKTGLERLRRMARRRKKGEAKVKRDSGPLEGRRLQDFRRWRNGGNF